MDLFHAKGCAGCHVGPDRNRPIVVAGPSLRNIAKVAPTRRPGLSGTGYIRESITDPNALVVGVAGYPSYMPTIDISARELDALVSYLARPSGSAAEPPATDPR